MHPTKITVPLTPDQAELVEQNQRIISILAYSFTSDTGLVADLVSVGNESICTAARLFDSRRNVSFADFARVVIRNDMLDFLKARLRRSGREVSQELLGESLEGEVAQEELGLDRWPSTVGVVSLESLDLERALDTLDELHRAVVVESVFEGRTMREIGTRRGKSHVWAWMRYQEALEQLRQGAILKNWYVEEPASQTCPKTEV